MLIKMQRNPPTKTNRRGTEERRVVDGGSDKELGHRLQGGMGPRLSKKKYSFQLRDKRGGCTVIVRAKKRIKMEEEKTKRTFEKNRQPPPHHDLGEKTSKKNTT